MPYKRSVIAYKRSRSADVRQADKINVELTNNINNMSTDKSVADNVSIEELVDTIGNNLKIIDSLANRASSKDVIDLVNLCAYTYKIISDMMNRNSRIETIKKVIK